MEQEVVALDRDGRALRVPAFMKELVAQVTFEARASNEISQASGVSVRVSINNYETLTSNAEKRALRTGEREIVPRLTDLHAVLASTAGKIELEYAGEDKKAEDLIDRLIGRAVLAVWIDTSRWTRSRASSPTSRPAGASRCPTACRRRSIARACRRSRACARPSRSWVRSRARG